VRLHSDAGGSRQSIDLAKYLQAVSVSAKHEPARYNAKPDVLTFRYQKLSQTAEFNCINRHITKPTDAAKYPNARYLRNFQNIKV
jgi:hypothetical protein